MLLSIRCPQFAAIAVLLFLPTLAPVQSARISPRIIYTASFFILHQKAASNQLPRSGTAMWAAITIIENAS